MIRRRDGRWFHNPDRELDRREETERFYGAGFISHGMRDRPLPKRYDERRYPPDYEHRPGRR